jgi:hypothetical protein
MTPKTCLRCDWEGETSEPSCPRCGARPLYVTGPSRVKEPKPVEDRGRSSDRKAALTASTTPPAFPFPPSDFARPTTDPLGPVRRPGGFVGTFVLVALVITATVVAWLTSNEPRTAAVPPRDDPAPSLFSMPSPVGIGSIKRLPGGENALNVDGVPFSFIVRRRGWVRFDGISINKSTIGPQGAEAIIFWTGLPDGDHADPCTHLLGPSAWSPGGDLAGAISAAPGTELVTGPSHVVVGGRPAEHVVLTVRDDVGCDPGFFYAWNGVDAGPFWSKTAVGSTIRVWIVDVADTRLFIEAATTKQAGSDLVKEVHQIVRSIRFHEAISVVVPNP